MRDIPAAGKPSREGGRAPTALFGRVPLVVDGGMGTSLVDLGTSPQACFEACNLENPDRVAAVHTAFVDAGAQAVWTNTFAANRYKLARFGRESSVRAINAAGVTIARDRSPFVVGAVGPLGVHLAPYGRLQRPAALEAYLEQIAALVEAGVDLVAVETQFDLAEVEQALVAARMAGARAVLASVTFTREDRTLLGDTPAQVGRRLSEMGADAVGINCSQGPSQARRLVAALRSAAGDLPVVVRPNAGAPRQSEGRLLYPTHARYFGEQARGIVAAGATAVGGCCGTGPAHIRAVVQALSEGVEPPPTATTVAAVADVPPRQPDTGSPVGAKLAAGRFVTAVEVDPPRSSSVDVLLAAAETLVDAGADAVTVSDSPMARMRMSPWAACRLIQEHTTLDAVLHFPTRGRNILRIQGDLLAAHALGTRTVFVCMGDPASLGDYPDASPTADIVPTGLIRLLSTAFNRGVDQAGASIGEATDFTIGCALSPGAADLERECRLLHRKIEAGADYALTQPVYSPEVLARFRTVYGALFGPMTLPLLVGVLPPVTARHAEFLHHEVPGIHIPDDIRARLHRAGSAAERESMRMTVELVSQLSDEAGLYVMPPFGRYDLAAELLEAVDRR